MTLVTVLPIVLGLFTLILPASLPVESYANLMETVFDFLSVVFYILPAGTIFTIFSIVLALNTWRIIVSIIKTLWDLLPIV